jgi:protein phosphatase
MATENAVHVGRDHVWHMETIGRMCEHADGVLFRTPYKLIDATDAAREAEGTAWWEQMTGSGGEGMVVKPLEFVVRGRRGLVQPAIKCRGREYLRIIYGPEYTVPVNLERLRGRGLAAKRSLALREFALGVEGLERLVRREPLRRVRELRVRRPRAGERTRGSAAIERPGSGRVIHHGSTEDTKNRHGRQQLLCCFLRVTSVCSVSPW